ncbi:prenylated rab acceptor 1-related [Anaeramoeba flamelloides]|uniref:PRA1 family protein n=1 Tax=Anaeramoeba flamelloides TaxID=1746091 RepID=A0ABQ8XH63_9EUKA|nr:prenylated rab acceptor 1-related [Anaeramoeba flamelloides]
MSNQDSVRDWSLLFQNLKFPKSDEIKKRIDLNFKYFLMNYVIIVLVASVSVLIVKPISIFAFSISFGLYFYLFFLNGSSTTMGKKMQPLYWFFVTIGVHVVSLIIFGGFFAILQFLFSFSIVGFHLLMRMPQIRAL